MVSTISEMLSLGDVGTCRRPFMGGVRVHGRVLLKYAERQGPGTRLFMMELPAMFYSPTASIPGAKILDIGGMFHCKLAGVDLLVKTLEFLSTNISSSSSYASSSKGSSGGREQSGGTATPQRHSVTMLIPVDRVAMLGAFPSIESTRCEQSLCPLDEIKLACNLGITLEFGDPTGLCREKNSFFPGSLCIFEDKRTGEGETVGAQGLCGSGREE